jgi:non-heme chloroperoxidase
MTTRTLRIVIWATLFGAFLHARDISGEWQGWLNADPIAIRITIRNMAGRLEATEFRIGQGSAGIKANFVTLLGSNLKLTFKKINATYEGGLSEDEDSIKGTWTQGHPKPVELKRLAAGSPWWGDVTSHNVQFVTVDKDVELEVVDWGGTGRPVILLAGFGNKSTHL